MSGGNNRNAPPLVERLWSRCERTESGCLEAAEDAGIPVIRYTQGGDA